MQIAQSILQTGTLGIEATFPNPDRLLRPGQYARLRAAIDQKQNAILVPQVAVQELQGYLQCRCGGFR